MLCFGFAKHRSWPLPCGFFVCSFSENSKINQLQCLQVSRLSNQKLPNPHVGYNVYIQVTRFQMSIFLPSFLPKLSEFCCNSMCIQFSTTVKITMCIKCYEFSSCLITIQEQKTLQQNRLTTMGIFVIVCCPKYSSSKPFLLEHILFVHSNSNLLRFTVCILR